MDVRLLGDEDGVMAAQRILESRPLPIVFMSGYSDAGTRKRMDGLDPVAILDKHLSLDVLGSVVDRVAGSQGPNCPVDK